MLTVQKFGGSSVASAERIKAVAGIIADKKHGGDEVVTVLSARGDMTDDLIASAAEISAAPPNRELDALLSTGELSSVALMAMQLHSMGLDCVSLSGRQAGIKTDLNHGEARIISIDTSRILRELRAGRIVLVAGFQGINENDDVSTLGRGGSDTTAVALAAALNADKCEIYSDVDGIFTADPRIIPEAKKLSRIDYGDMLLLAKGGSQILHSRAVEAAMKYGVTIHALSSFEKGSGTLVTEISDITSLPPFCGLTRDKNGDAISLVGRGADTVALSEAIYALDENGIEMLSAAVFPNLIRISVKPELVIPAMEILHDTFLA